MVATSSAVLFQRCIYVALSDYISEPATEVLNYANKWIVFVYISQVSLTVDDKSYLALDFAYFCVKACLEQKQLDCIATHTHTHTAQ